MTKEINLTFTQMSEEEIASTYLDVLSVWDRPLIKTEPVFISHKQSIDVSAQQKEKE